MTTNDKDKESPDDAAGLYVAPGFIARGNPAVAVKARVMQGETAEGGE